MNCDPRQRVESTEELKETLLEFTINCLLKHPCNVINYASDYFSCLKRAGFIYAVNINETTYSSDTFTESIAQETVVDELNIERSETMSKLYDLDDYDYKSKPYHKKSFKERRNLLAIIRDILLFRSLPNEQMEEMLDAFFKINVQPGDNIIKKGVIDHFYVIQSGVYKVYVTDDDSQTKHVHTYEECGNFGELALLHDAPNPFTIEATTEGILWAIDGVTFRHIVNKFNEQQEK